MFRSLFGRSSVAEVTPQDAKARQQAGAVLVDVREVNEWRAGHIPGALHIPLGSLTQRVQELDPTKETIVVCQSGNRSISGTLILQKHNFTQVSSMAGGMSSWTRSGLPTKH